MPLSELIEIDNPAQGNCAFYAFAIALIPHLKVAVLTEGDNSFVLNKLIKYLPRDIPEQQFKINILTFDYNKNNEDFLNIFNTILRNILADTREKLTHQALEEKTCEDKLKALSSIDLFNDVLGVFRAHYNFEESLNDEYNNDVYRDYDANTLLEWCSRQLNINGYDSVPLSVNQLDSKYESKISTDSKKRNDRENLAEAFVFACMFSNKEKALKLLHAEKRNVDEKQMAELLLKEIKLEKNSICLELINYKRAFGVWGTESDLNCLAAHGLSRDHKNPEILVAIVVNGENNCSHMDTTKIQLIVNNRDNIHWTTFIDKEELTLQSKNEMVRLFAKYNKHTVLDVEEVIGVLNDYTGNNNRFRRIIEGKWQRNYIDLANEMVGLMEAVNADDDEEKTISKSDLYNLIVDSCKKCKVKQINPDGSFMKALNYLLIRASCNYIEYTELHAQLLQDIRSEYPASVFLMPHKI